MKSALLCALAVAPGARTISGPVPTPVDYTLRVDSANRSGISVEMHILGSPAGFRVAMATHAEYDDQYWRYLTDLNGTSTRGAVVVTREDRSVWRVVGPAGDVTLRYRVGYPASLPQQQAAWKAHLTAEGGLIGGPHSFLYVVGGERAPVRVTLTLPKTWTVAAGLAPGAHPGDFIAPDADALIDSPARR